MITANGKHCSTVRLIAGWRGVWFADVDCVEPLTGAVELQIDEATFRGTASGDSFAFGGEHRTTIVGGAGGWSKVVSPLPYHNDAGVKPLNVAQDLAREVGETLGQFSVTSRLGADFARDGRAASRILEAAIGDVDWFVDYDGVTHVGARSPRVVESGYRLLSVSRSGELELDVDGAQVIRPGDVVTVEGAQRTIRSIVVIVGETLRVEAATQATSPAELFSAIVQHEISKRLFGVYHYVVVSTDNDRVNLEPFDARRADLPDLRLVSQWAAPGVYAALKDGAEVGVVFLDGDRSRPVIVAHEGRPGDNHEPDRIDLGGADGVPAAPVGATVNVFFPPSIPFTGLLDGVPITGVMTPLQSATGVIQGLGSDPKVMIKI